MGFLSSVPRDIREIHEDVVVEVLSTPFVVSKTSSLKDNDIHVWQGRQESSVTSSFMT